jgi:heme/copper-type cytochrome/quinol oxidase subunit 3
MKKTNLNLTQRYQKHPFHIVDPSPWPFFTSMSALYMVLGLVMYLHFYEKGFTLLFTGLILLLLCMGFWWRDVVREATFEGQHTSYVRKGLKLGMLLFIVSEAMVFFSFFWAFFHSSLNPVPEIGSVWPPKGIDPIDPWKIPFLNTVVLLTSGATVTWAHYSILYGLRKNSIQSLICTLGLAIFFTGLQFYEYVNAPFNFSDGVYGSVFYMITGWHGFHVIIGTLFLLVCLLRLVKHHFTKNCHVGLECAIWYWHFVDIVWIFVYFFVYWWGFGDPNSALHS